MRNGFWPGLVLCLLLLLTKWAHADSRKLMIGGRERTISVFRPATLGQNAPVPLVIMLHGGFGTGAQAEKSYHWDEMATAKGFVVAYPDGVRRSWNAGGTCCGPAFKDNVDDVGFLDALIATLSKTENIDPRRIYLTGISNGAAMSYHFACEGKTPVAAIGSVAGTMAGGCQTARAVSVMEIHGLQDQNIPILGGVGSKGVTRIDWPSVQTTIDHFHRADQCGPATATKNGVVERSDARCSQTRAVSLITIAAAGHQWPGAIPERPLLRRLFGLDAPSAAMDATATLWTFFETHPAP